MKAVFLCNDKRNPLRIYDEATRKKLKNFTDITDDVYSREEVLKNKERFSDTRYIFSTWGMPVFSEEEIKDIFPSLECVFYGAGTVQFFARPFLNSGVKVFSSWAANAVPVAEYTVAQIILANKGFFAASRCQSTGNLKMASELKECYPGSFGESVGLIGAGMIGSLAAGMLKAYRLSVKVFDPFLSDEKADLLGVTKCSLEEIFSTCFVISNHLADNEKTKGMLKKEHFSSMRKYATFINTGRGAQVVEEDLCAVLSEREDLTAILDVTYPEPPDEGHPFYSLPNCILTPHIAGSYGDEVKRMGEYQLAQFKKYLNGEHTEYEVSLKMLETMA